VLRNEIKRKLRVFENRWCGEYLQLRGRKWWEAGEKTA
jgi:hypothetical protein